MLKLACAASVVLLSLVLSGQTDSPVPESLRPPATVHPVLQTHAMGVQIYGCAKDANGGFAWILEGPRAELRDANGTTLIEHSAGPTWQHRDGSKITGKVVAKSDAPQPGAIPWLLLTANHSASGEGVLHHVEYIQRLRTSGGQPPAEACTEDKAGSEFQSHYSADYVFFAP